MLGSQKFDILICCICSNHLGQLPVYVKIKDNCNLFTLKSWLTFTQDTRVQHPETVCDVTVAQCVRLTYSVNYSTLYFLDRGQKLLLLLSGQFYCSLMRTSRYRRHVLLPLYWGWALLWFYSQLCYGDHLEKIQHLALLLRVKSFLSFFSQCSTDQYIRTDLSR